jgi:hypothetical protein
VAAVAAVAVALGGAAARPALAAPSTPSSQTVQEACGGPLSTPAGCDAASLLAIDAARADQGLGPLELPPDFLELGPADQLIAVTNAERLSRGLPAWSGPDQALSDLAGRGLAARADPAGPAGSVWASNLADGVLTTLQADYEWMYNDGPGGANRACTAPGAPMCWAHRDNVLRPWQGTIGAAQAPTGRRLVLGELMVKGS